MTWLAFILALVFGAAAGGMWIWGRVAEGKARAYLFAGGAVAMIQALSFGVMATYPSLQTPGYIAVLAVVGVGLVGALAYLGSRPGQ